MTPATIATWMHRLDERGPDALVRPSAPVNRFPDLVRLVVQELAATLPTMGKVRIAHALAQAGLHLAPTTVRRFRKEQPRGAFTPPCAPNDEAHPRRIVTARRPHDVWNIDLTIVPTGAGFWVPWFPVLRGV